MKKTILAALVVSCCSPAVASDYFVVVPVPNRAATAGNILVSLNAYSPPIGVVGEAYAGFDFNTVLSVKGDPAFNASNVRWSVADGALPAGLTLSAGGQLSGTPTAAGASSFQLLAAYKTKAGQQAYTVTVNNLVVSLAAAALPNGVQGAVYSYDLKPKLAVTGDPAFSGSRVTWSVVSGSLPAGLSLTADGVITGTPSAENTGAPFTIQAAYKTKTGQQAYQVMVGAITVALGSAALPAGQQGAVYSFDLKPKLAVAGDAAFNFSGVTWSVVSGSLPDGLSLSTDGVISGTPSAESTGAPFTIQAAYKTKTGQQAYSVLVGAIVVSLADATPPTGIVGQPYSGIDLKASLTVSGDAAYRSGTGVTWAVQSGALPAGLTLDASTGIVSGAPTVPNATAAATIQASYKSKSASKAYAFPVVAQIQMSGSSRTWSDGTYATSCKGYRTPTSSNYRYQGTTGNGTYRIKPGSTAIDVYCDQTTDGGGWTLVLKSDFNGMRSEVMGEGTSGVCTSLTDSCLTSGTSAFYRGTAVQATITDYMFLKSAAGVSGLYNDVLLLKAAGNYIRGPVTAPGTQLYDLMTDTTEGWASPLNHSTDPSDMNLYRFGSSNGNAWSDGNWHGCGTNWAAGLGGAACGTYAYQAGAQVMGPNNDDWGNHLYMGPPTYNASTGLYTLQPWTYWNVAPDQDFGSSRTISKAALEAWRWAVFVR